MWKQQEMEIPYIKKSKLRKKLIDFLAVRDFQFGVTLAFNNPHRTYLGGLRRLKGWDAKINRRLLGSAWSRKPKESRIFFLAFPEYGKSDDNLHYHLAVSIPQRLQDFPEVAKQAWKQLEAAGDADIKTLKSKLDLRRWLKYITKEYNANMDYYILSTEFIKE